MNKLLRKFAMTIAFLITAGTYSMNAQTAYRANIPFDFTVGKKAYKAGDYSVDYLNRFEASRRVVLRDSRGRNAYVFITEIDRPRVESAVLMFDLVGSRYVLSAITTPVFAVEIVRETPEKKKIGSSQEKIAMIPGR